jgi:hypothetical protein
MLNQLFQIVLDGTAVLAFYAVFTGYRPETAKT